MTWARIFPWGRPKPEVLMLPPLVVTISGRAITLIQQQDEEHPGPHQGEAKRHRVYAQLIKEYPWTSWADVALAIEVAIQRTRT